MKKLLFQGALFLLLCSATTFAQNKSLAVGTATANPNAALHVESPTGNQGAIMPRLSTAQRTAMAGILGTVDAGILLYDNDLKALFIWDGDSWESSAKLSMPFKDSVITATGTTDLFALKYNNAENKRIMRIENLNRSNGSSAVSVSNNGSGLGLYVQNTNDTTAVSTVYVTNNSNNINATPGPVSIYGESTGLAGSAGSFKVVNPTNNRSAVYAETLGTGNSIFSRHSGVNGHAGYFWVSDTTNYDNAIRAQTDGQGSAARLELTNPNNSSAALQINHYGVGVAINAIKTTNGGVANFQNVDPTNNYNVMELSTNGNGYALNASSSGNQRVAYFTLSNPTSTAPAVSINSNALVDALEVYAFGQGKAATFGADSAAEVIQVRTDGANTMGGSFFINNPSNAQAAIYGQSSGTGSALVLNQTNNRAALSIMQGGLQYNVFEPAITGPITTRATIYKMTTSGSYSIAWPATTGDAFYVYNDSGDSIFIGSDEVVFGFSGFFVYLGTAWVKF